MDPRIGNWQFQKVKSEAAFRLTMKKNAVDSEQYCGVPSCSKCGKREKNTTLKQHSGLCAVCSAPRCDAPDEEFYGKVIENPTPKFKVGDRVKYIGQVFGEILKPDVEYTVRTVCKISGLELYGLECAYFKTSRFELIPSTPQIEKFKLGHRIEIINAEIAKSEGVPLPAYSAGEIIQDNCDGSFFVKFDKGGCYHISHKGIRIEVPF